MQNKRKVFHLLGLLILLYFITSKQVALITLSILLIVEVLVEVMRKRDRMFNRLITRFFKPILRKHEENSIFGTLWFILGVLLSVILFPKEIAILAVLFLSFGDVAAEIGGRALGNIVLLKGKTLEGSMSGLIVNIIVVYVYTLATGFNIWIAVAGAFAGSLAETFSFNINDNFSIPLVSGLVMFILSLLI